MSEPRAMPGRRPRRSGAGTERLEQLRANKAKLDAEKAERERLEETALASLAEQWSRVEELKQARDDKLAELQKEGARLRADAKAQIEAVQAQQAAALAQLHAAGRTAEEIAALVELPKDRVRKALRAAALTTKPSADPPPRPVPRPVPPAPGTTETRTGSVIGEVAERPLASSA